MDETDRKIMHLEFIQRTINRMASMSFAAKGLCIILAIIVFILLDRNNIIVVYIPIISFWIVDGYFLSQERLYRSLYDDVRPKKVTDFSMNTKKYEGGRNSWIRSIFSKTLIIFYMTLAILTLMIMIIK